MIFDLHGRDRRVYLVDGLPQHWQVEVAHADCARATFITERCQRLHDDRHVHVLRRPVDHVEIDVIELQLLDAGVESTAN